MSILDTILVPIIGFIEHTIATMGPMGVALLMAIESCNIPLPSEAILPFAGYLVSKGVMSIHVAAFAAFLVPHHPGTIGTEGGKPLFRLPPALHFHGFAQHFGGFGIAPLILEAGRL